jgi:tetratricopeptide (TPR) repeat protein
VDQGNKVSDIGVSSIKALGREGLGIIEILGATAEEEKRSVAEGHYRFAKIYYDKADFNQARSNFLRALKNVESPRDGFLMFKILGFLIRIASERLDNDEAAKFIEQSNILVQSLESSLPRLNAEFFYNQGIVFTYHGKFIEARQNFLMAYQEATNDNEKELLVKTLYALAMGAWQMKEFEKARDHLDELLRLLEVVKKTYILGSTHILYGNICVELKDYAEAIRHYKIGNEALVDKNCWNLYSYILLGQAVTYKKLGEFTKALTFLDQGLAAVDQNNFKRLGQLFKAEIKDVNDLTVDIYLDRTNRLIYERNIGTVDFKHRFVLLEILFLLAKNPGVYYDKEQLARLIWRDDYNPLIHDKLIYTSVSRLRKLIDPKGDKKKYVIRGKDGYTFNPQVKIRFHRETGPVEMKAIGNIDITNPV